MGLREELESAKREEEAARYQVTLVCEKYRCLDHLNAMVTAGTWAEWEDWDMWYLGGDFMRCLTDEEIIRNIQLREAEAIADAAPYSSPPSAGVVVRAGVVVLGWEGLVRAADVLMETGADAAVGAGADP